jgi:hypothetical protein
MTEEHHEKVQLQYRVPTKVVLPSDTYQLQAALCMLLPCEQQSLEFRNLTGTQRMHLIAPAP